MADFLLQIAKVEKGGPYSWVLFKDGQGMEARPAESAETAFSDALKTLGPASRVLAQVTTSE